MAKILKIVARSLGIALECFVALFLIFAFVIRTSPAQTYIANKATAYLSEELNTEVKIDNVDIVFFDRLFLDGFLIRDQSKDTLGSFKSVNVVWKTLGVFSDEIHLSDIKINGGVAKINKTKKGYNYDFIVEYFTSEEEDDTEPMPFLISNLSITNLRFQYDDYQQKPVNNQLDFNHLAISNLNSKIVNFKSFLDTIKFDIASFSAKEASGFELQNISSDVFISEQAIKLKQLKINVLNSEFSFPKFNFLLNSFADFDDFENKVRLDVDMDTSLLSLKDLSYFVPEIKGMNQKIFLSGTFENVINNLALNDFSLCFGNKSKINGSFKLPDLKNLYHSKFNQQIDYMYLDVNDIKNIKLPSSSSEPHISIDPIIERLSFMEIINTEINGELFDFNLGIDTINSQMGVLGLRPINIKWDTIAESLIIDGSQNNGKSISMSSFNIGELIDEPSIKKVSGEISLKAIIPSDGDFLLDKFSAELSRVNLDNYTYNNVSLKNGSFLNNKLLCDLNVNDKNLKMNYHGVLDFNNKGHYKFKLDLDQALLNALNFSRNDSLASFNASLLVDLSGNSLNNLNGSVSVINSNYKEGENSIIVPEFVCHLERGEEDDELNINSSLFDFNLKGKFDFNTIAQEFTEQFYSIIPSSSNNDKISKAKQKKSDNNFTYQLSFRNANTLFNNFLPGFVVSSGTKLYGRYNSLDSDFELNLDSDMLLYKNFSFSSVDVSQQIKNGDINAKYTVQSVQIGDSINIDNVSFKSIGVNNHLESHLTWDPTSTYASDIYWMTDIVSSDIVSISIKPSTFSINQKEWNLMDSSEILISGTDLQIDDLTLQRGMQSIQINGCVSDANYDGIKLTLSNIDLSELDQIFYLNAGMEGQLNGEASLSDPLGVIRFTSQLKVDSLSMNGRKVGDVSTLAAWNPIQKCISLDGELDYLGNKTFDFAGNYYVEKEKNNMDFNFIFDQMNIEFANAFLDPDVVKDLSGVINGKLKVGGELINPKIDGKLFLDEAKANVALLGVDLTLNGQINVLEDAFTIDNMPVSDEDGNVSNLNASIYHSNFSNWNYNMFLDLEYNPIENSVTDKFLLMNTAYVDGDYYFGKAYATGFCEIEGDDSYIRVSVDLESRKGTKINFPMYGTSEYSDDDQFITFLTKDVVEIIEPKVDFSSVDLDLNFTITPDAEIKLTFNEQTGDEIIAFGTGNLNMAMNDVHELKLEGDFNIENGSRYDFAMGQIKQVFDIQPGSKIVWTGDAYDADINLITSFSLKSDYGDLAPELLINDKKALSNKNVNCFLNLTESLLKPKISFNLTSDPTLPETGKALLSRVISDQSELNRQFFSLLLFHSFQPLQGQISASGSAALNLVESQINSLLGMVSKDYKLRFNIESGEYQGNSSSDETINSEYSVMEFDVSKSFLDNRLIVSGSFGVETGVMQQSSDDSKTNDNSLIGDVMLEYLINESGTFRINAFNESNRNTIYESSGMFSQGAGINYQEEFDNWKDFKLFQSFLDIFRRKKDKRIKVKRKKKQKKVPYDDD